MVEGMTFLHYLRDRSPAKAMPETKEAVAALKSLKREDEEEYMKFNKKSAIYYATVGPRDALCAPAGWLFHEKVLGADCYGIHLQFLKAADLEQLDTFQQYLQSKHKSNEPYST